MFSGRTMKTYEKKINLTLAFSEAYVNLSKWPIYEWKHFMKDLTTHSFLQHLLNQPQLCVTALPPRSSVASDCDLQI